MSASKNPNPHPSFISSYVLAYRLGVPHGLLVQRVRFWIYKNLPSSMKGMVLVNPDCLLVDASLIPTVDAEFSLVCH